MLNTAAFDNGFYLVVGFALVVLKLFAFVDALLHSNPEYEAAGKLTKPAWCTILGIGLAVQLILGGLVDLLTLAFAIAAIVYIVDVRPAIRGLRRR
ncbi:DUF2516 family protein [Nocardioides acrostichi]|uniref:DUF2516 family protein n=1 Tax=Nocardioides acrostichi TaxID=2784339 RepID=A0A930UYN1_9ACTN|nr:DUF2516 family protein [Nocardioides acrostichi]MBF4162521.1 DUF2516 family protein [Nocardioides acrostichi]